MPPVDAVLFDLDDTLLDWASAIRVAAGDDLADALLGWAAEHLWKRRDGIVVARDTWRLHEFADELWPLALADWDPDDVRLALKRFREELWVGFYPDVVPTLDHLVDLHRLAVCSNNPYVATEAERLRLRDWFEAIELVPQDRRKPHPEAFLRVCEHLGTAPERTVHVGDSVLADVEGAHGAGLIAVWLDRHGDAWPLPPGVHRITTLTELPDLLAGLEAG
jgi:putative hydrolase of the HAD superfamily